ncbi:unnamed protein product, partial [Brassica rapa]
QFLLIRFQVQSRLSVTLLYVELCYNQRTRETAKHHQEVANAEGEKIPCSQERFCHGVGQTAQAKNRRSNGQGR